MTSSDDLRWEPPGPGSWKLDRVHFPRPMTHLAAENFGPSFLAGFREGSRRYGTLMDGPRFVPVNRFVYSQAVAAGRARGGGPTPWFVFRLRHRVYPELRRRKRSAARAFADKRWREDVRQWERQVKPASVARHTALLDREPPAMSEAELSRHLQDCSANARDMIAAHARFTFAAMIPTGDFMAHTTRWTGKTIPELMPLMAGASPASSGWLPEAGALVNAIRADPEAAALLDSDEPPAEILEHLRSANAAVGEAMRRWLVVFGYRVVAGYDIADPLALDQPDLLLEALRRFAYEGRHDDSEIAEAAAAEVREQVPAEQRESFDGLLQEARATYYLRDERGLYTDSCANGVLQRAVLEVGRRAVTAGRVHDARHALEAGTAELEQLIAGDGGPEADELAARDAYRRHTSGRAAPPRLGDAPVNPPPLDWLSPPLRRVAAALFTTMGQMGDAPGVAAAAEREVITGRGACAGVYEGTARLVHTPHEIGAIQPGDVLVTPSTSPSFTVVLPRIAAIVTDHGGVLSHAAIVAREYGLPAVVGCQVAMTTIPDGARIRVDADAGEVTLLGR